MLAREEEGTRHFGGGFRVVGERGGEVVAIVSSWMGREEGGLGRKVGSWGLGDKKIR